MDAEHAVESAQAVVAVGEFLVAVAAEASPAGVADVESSEAVALAAQVVDLHLPARAHLDTGVPPVHLCRVGLSAPKDH